MSYKPEVFVDGKWYRNGLAFATEAEAQRSALNLMDRWINVEDARAVEVAGMPATHVLAPTDVDADGQPVYELQALPR